MRSSLTKKRTQVGRRAVLELLRTGWRRNASIELRHPCVVEKSQFEEVSVAHQTFPLGSTRASGVLQHAHSNVLKDARRCSCSLAGCAWATRTAECPSAGARRFGPITPPHICKH